MKPGSHLQWLTIVLAALLAASMGVAAGAGEPGIKRPMKPEDLYSIARVSEPRVSPDGGRIAFTVTYPDLTRNVFDSDIWIIPAEGGEPRRLTSGPGEDHSPRWSPDGIRIAFLSDRGGEENLWMIRPDGGEARRLTLSATALESPRWLPDGSGLICISRVLPGGAGPGENPYQHELPLCEARTIERLLYRQWDRWLGNERNHLVHVSTADGAIRDLTPGKFDTPPVSLAGAHDFDVAPDGSEFCFVRNVSGPGAPVLPGYGPHRPGGEAQNPEDGHPPFVDPWPALSTNHDLFTGSFLTTNGFKSITSNPALDTNPVYGPGGRYLAHAATAREGYESDTRRLVVIDRKNGEKKVLTSGLDRSVSEIVWHPGGDRLFFTARDEGSNSIYTVGTAGGQAVRLTNEGYNCELNISPDGAKLFFIRSYCHQPDEIYSMTVEDGEVVQLTRMNRNLIAELDLPQLKSFQYAGAGGTPVHGFLLEPPGFDPAKKYPVVLTIHGGPQGMWADRFMTTWFTFPLVAAPGYVGIFLNPRGSSGYGALFREQVSREYGGSCYEDLMAGLDYVIETYPFIDGSRQAAIGGSFGGYSVNWIMGRTGRFRCLVSHAGLYNLESFYGATEELWYPAWDMGLTPWDEPEIYARWSPHKMAGSFNTPTMITHGQLDYRVPVTEGLQLFTALQVRKVPSRLVYFPDEGHVITAPQNNVRWWKEIHRWLDYWLNPAGTE